MVAIAIDFIGKIFLPLGLLLFVSAFSSIWGSNYFAALATL